MTQPHNANDILMGNAAPAFKFSAIGDGFDNALVLEEPTATQQTDFRTKTPEIWPDGSPKMQVLVVIQTDQRDPSRPDDDGARTVYVKGKEMTNAVRSGVRASGANGIHKGGRLSMRYIADGPAQQGMNAPKLYSSQYQPPAVSFAGVGTPAVQQQYAAPAQQPVQPQYVPHQQAIQQPQAQSVNAPAAPPGVDPAMWARLTPAQQQAVIAASAAQPQPAF